MVDESRPTKPTRIAGVQSEAGGRSDAKGKRKKEVDDVSEIVELKQERKRQKTTTAVEEPVGTPPTTATNSCVLPARDAGVKPKVAKKVEAQSKQQQASGKGVSEVTTTQAVRRVELGTPLTNATKEDDGVEVKQEKKRQKTIKGIEEPVLAPPPTKATSNPCLPARDTVVKSKISKKVGTQEKQQQEGEERGNATAGGERTSEATMAQVVRRVELGTLTNTTNDPAWITTDIPPKASQIGKSLEILNVKGKQPEQNTLEGKRRKIATQEKPTTPPTNVTEEDDPLFTPNGRTNEDAEDEIEVVGQVTSVDEEKPDPRYFI